ncbi:dihydrodipicolinate synthase family protein [Alkalihalobacillus oceani]|uniref:dihydrodipicolinate synthase family protein n=1 Tax=Halalkalibacter oceani TaxID=1653776 RepID=UPI00203A74B7|nr:dihydrodipicolinate synthase family protein [Halalkalibacter oceani]MCM3763108.1 dihydrodipicolinate synthase family protein [Halalkalibacter oceani]
MDYRSFGKRFEDISGITITPFKEESKEIDWNGVKENVEFLINRGINVLVPCGNTSEFYALTLEEAKEEIRYVVECANKRATVLAGVGYSVATAIEMGNYAKDVGADCIMIHMPIHPFMTDDGVVDYFKSIIENVDLPAVIYFKNPAISDRVLEELSSLDRLVAVKYAINDLPRFARTVQSIPANRDITWVCGVAEKWAPFFFHAGATGFTSGLVNLYPEKSLELLEALKTKDEAKIWSVWNEVLPFENLREKYNSGVNVAIVKEGMRQLGLNAGVTREPVSPLSTEDKAAVRSLIQRWKLDIRKQPQ